MATTAQTESRTPNRTQSPLRVVPKGVGTNADLCIEFDVKVYTGSDKPHVQKHRIDASPPRTEAGTVPPPMLAQFGWHVKTILEEHAAMRTERDDALRAVEDANVKLAQCNREQEKLTNQLNEARRRLENGKAK